MRYRSKLVKYLDDHIKLALIRYIYIYIYIYVTGLFMMDLVTHNGFDRLKREKNAKR